MEKCSTVCVTGASGYIGSILVKKLLERGHTVHATLRDLGNDTKTGLLKKLPGADTRVKLFEADIYNSSSFESAIQGCSYIFLTATPLQHKADSTQFQDTSEASLDAIQKILHLCEKSGTVKRIIYTGSVFAASALNEDGTGLSGYLDESRWTPLNLSVYPSNFEAAYTSSKALSEKALLNYNANRENSSSLEVVSLCIGLVGGATILSYVPGSVTVILSPLTGNMICYTQIKLLQEMCGSVPLIHIDDVCEALIFCMEEPSMTGRFMCAAVYPSLNDILDFYRNVYPDIAVIKEVDRDYPRVEGRSTKLVDIGFTYKYGVEEILRDSFHCAKNLGYFK